LLKDHNIICIASANWDAVNWVNVQHIMSRLARENRILYVESFGLRPPSAKRQDLRRILRRVTNFLIGINMVSDNIYLFSPVIVPYHGYRLARWINKWILKIFLRRYIRVLKMKDPIFWVFLPNAVDLIGQFNEKLVVYHCVDEYSANPGVPAKEIRELELETLSKSDIVFTTSHNLYRNKKPFNQNTHYIPNVANTKHFRKVLSSKTRVARELDNIKGPIIGFIGNVSSYKIDLKLIKKIAQYNSNWSLVLIGPVGLGDVDTDISSLDEMSNVHLVGPRNYGALPNFIKGFDVCIIPFVVNETTKSSFPMKFYEYMASGKPIVSVDLDAISQYKNRPEICRIASGHDDFCRAIEQTLEHKPTEEEINKRLEIAEKNSWETRIEDICSTIEQSLSAKSGEQT
jgi:glycosyltransferase involved in cell wall biosynthesis